MIRPVVFWVGIILFGFFTLNYYANWKIFGEYDGFAFVVFTLVGLVLVMFLIASRGTSEAVVESEQEEALPLHVSPLFRFSAIAASVLMMTAGPVITFGGFVDWDIKYSGLVTSLGIIGLVCSTYLLTTQESESD